MSQEILYVGDVATFVSTLIDRVTKAPVALPNAPQSFTWRRPDGSDVTLTYVPVTDGSNGQFTYRSVGGGSPDLAQHGTYYVQPTPTDGVGPFAADADTFVVKPRI